MASHQVMQVILSSLAGFRVFTKNLPLFYVIVFLFYVFYSVSIFYVS